MNKTFILALALAGTLTAAAQSLSETTPQWARAFTVDPAISTTSGNGQTTMGENITLATDGNLLAFLNYGGGSEDSNLYFGEDLLAPGTPYYVGTSSPTTFALAKISPDGTPLWCVYTLNGEIYNGGNVVATADGGAIVACTVRHHDNGTDRPLQFIDAAGISTFIQWTTDVRYYRPLLIKIASNGTVEWTRLLEVNHDPQPGSSSTATTVGVYVNATVIDDDGNIYVSGNQRTDIYVGDVTIKAHNVDGWNGDSQKSVGSAYLIKFDSNGNYVAHITTTSDITQDNIRCLTYANGRLYALFHITGKGESTDVAFGGKSVIVPENKNLHISAACLSTDLSAEWLQLYPNTLDKATTLQVPQIKVINGTLWLAAEGQIGLMAGGKDVNTGTLTRDGLLVKFDAATGDALGGITLGKGWSGFFDVAPMDDEHIYAARFDALYGPMVLTAVNTTTLAIDDEVTLASSVSTANNIVIKGNDVYAMFRVRGNVTIPGSELTLSSSQFAAAIAAYRLPAVASPLDVNGDGEVNVGDVNAVLNMVLSETYDTACDVNDDGAVNVGDVNIILNTILQ